MEKEKNLIIIIIYYLKVNIRKGKEMEKVKNIMIRDFYDLKENI